MPLSEGRGSWNQALDNIHFGSRGADLVLAAQHVTRGIRGPKLPAVGGGLSVQPQERTDTLVRTPRAQGAAK